MYQMSEVYFCDMIILFIEYENIVKVLQFFNFWKVYYEGIIEEIYFDI